MNTNCKILVVLIIGMILNCSGEQSLNVDKTEGRLQVLSILSPGFERAEVYVGIAYPESSPKDISGAEVNLSDSLNTILLTEVQPGLYQDLSNSLIIQPEKKYYLYVTTFDGKIYYDSTFVPPIPEIINYSQGDTLHTYYSKFEIKVPTIKFRQEDFTHGYFVGIIFSNNGKEYYAAGKTDSLETKIPIPFSPNFFINLISDTLFYQQARLQVWGLDSSAVYIDNQYGWGEDRIKWNLFGSMSMSEINVTIEFKFEAPKLQLK